MAGATASALGHRFERNSLPAINDVRAAQRFLDKQLETDRPRLLTRIARMMNPCTKKS
jgi:hypothetical protein